MNHLLFNPNRMYAILQRGFDQTNLVGSVGGVTYRRVGGVTIASQKVPMHVAHTRTAALMLTRMKWVNLVALWKAINQTGWHPSFERENRRISDFNMFLRANFAAANTFITKTISRAYGCVVAPCRLTTGSFLSEITCDFGGTNFAKTSIAYASTLGNSTTVKLFSDTIIAGNTGWQYGDKLTILIVRQEVNNSVPFANAFAVTVTLGGGDYESTTLLKDLFDVSILTVTDGYLALSGSLTGGVAAVHSRIVDGETLCSPALLVVNSTILTNYQGLTAFNAAAESYGGVARNQLLTPDTTTDFMFQP